VNSLCRRGRSAYGECHSKEFDVEMPLRAFFDRPTIAEVASLVGEILISQVDSLTEQEEARLLQNGD
jgi:hypothetical protein